MLVHKVCIHCSGFDHIIYLLRLWSYYFCWYCKSINYDITIKLWGFNVTSKSKFILVKNLVNMRALPNSTIVDHQDCGLQGLIFIDIYSSNGVFGNDHLLMMHLLTHCLWNWLKPKSAQRGCRLLCFSFLCWLELWWEEVKIIFHFTLRVQGLCKREWTIVQEEDAKRELQKMELLTKAQTNAAVTAEKARQLEDTKELQIQVLASVDYYHRPPSFSCLWPFWALCCGIL